MIPDQTAQIFLGVLIALFYAGAVLALGVLPLTLCMNQQERCVVRSRIGRAGFIWLGFILGQGFLGVVWLLLSLAGVLYNWCVWIVCFLGWLSGFVMLYRARHLSAGILRIKFWLLRSSSSWYFWIGVSMILICLLRGIIALLPPSVDDALHWYLTVAKVIAFGNKLEFQPFIAPHSGLYPLQVEMHWAALFTISNETAVTVWDYFCALSLLCGIGCLSWSLIPSRRAALLSALILLSSSAFHEMMGAGKTDNAGAQYGIAAFLCIILWPDLRRLSAALTGLCLGWALAARYTNFIIIPSLIVFAIVIVRRSWMRLSGGVVVQYPERFWSTKVIVGSLAAILAGAPMLVKNWLLVGCPLAPQWGCQNTFWAEMFLGRDMFWASDNQDISLVNVLSYPFIMTFTHQGDMLGNISPLFLGFLPFLLLYYRSSLVQPTLIAGGAGLLSVVTWNLLINQQMLFARWALVPLGLCAVTLGAAVVAYEKDLLGKSHASLWLVRSAVLNVIVVLLFQSRATVYGVRYLAAIDSRAPKYQKFSHFGYDTATWLNAHVHPGQRVALGIWDGYAYFVDPNILVNAGSAEEYQWFWENRDRPSGPDAWPFYTQHGFTYVVISKDHVDDAKATLPDSVKLQVVFLGLNDAILKIEEL